MRELRNKRIDERQIQFHSCALVADELIFSTNSSNILMRLNLKTTSVENICSKALSFCVDQILSKDNRVYLLELYGDLLQEFDIKDNSSKIYNINCHEKNWGNFIAFTIYGSKLYIFPKYKKEIVIIDLENDSIKHQTIVYDETVHSERNLEDIGVTFALGCVVNDDMWLWSSEKSIAMKYNFENNSINLINLPDSFGCSKFVAWHEGIFYLLDEFGTIVEWNGKDNETKFICKIPMLEKDVEEVFLGKIVVTDKNLWVLPGKNKDIFVVDLLKRTVEVYNNYPENFCYNGPVEWSKYYSYCEDMDTYYFPMRTSNFLLIIEKREGKARWVHPTMPMKQEWIKLLDENKIVFFDENTMTLNEYLDYLECRKWEREPQKKNVVCGKAILDATKC